MGTVARQDFNDELLLQYATALKTDVESDGALITA
jgi:hypothetical protein